LALRKLNNIAQAILEGRGSVFVEDTPHDTASMKDK
jgi:hypothetical protein